jgi:glycosyltransferase involved in cell wall biosynthesis
MPKVLRIINRFNIGGPTFNVAYLTKYINEHYETLLIGGDKEAGEGSSLHILDELEIKVHIVKHMQRKVSFLSDIKAFFEIRNIISEFKPTIVHTHASKAGAVGRLAAISKGVPFIVHTFHGHVFHSYFGPLKTKVYIFIERFLARFTHRLIAISDIQKKELIADFKIAPAHKWRVVPLGFNLDRFTQNKEIKRADFRNKFGVKDDEIVIGIVGRLAEIKHHTFFIDLITAFNNPKLKFFIVGDGHLKEPLMQYANDKGIQNAYLPEGGQSAILTFTSWILNMDWFYSGADIIALTSKNEGTPVSLIEAQAAEKWIITTDVGGVRNILPANYPYCYAVNDANGFISGLKEILAIYASKSYINSADVIQKFGYQRLVNDMEKVYDEMLNTSKI